MINRYRLNECSWDVSHLCDCLNTPCYTCSDWPEKKCRGVMIKKNVYVLI